MNLCGVDLSDSPGYMFPAVNLAVLETLRVASCPGLYVMLTGMSNLPAASKPRIRRLQIYHEKPRLPHEWVSAGDNTDRTLKSTNDFLLSMKDSLKRLWIVMRGIDSRDRLLNALAPGIAHHGASLEHLYLDIRSHQPPFDRKQCIGWFSGEVWEQVCASMGRLEALYVPFPPMVANDANEKFNCRREFDHYLVWISSCLCRISEMPWISDRVLTMRGRIVHSRYPFSKHLTSTHGRILSLRRSMTLPFHVTLHLTSTGRGKPHAQSQSTYQSTSTTIVCRFSPRTSFSGALSSFPTPIDISRL